MSLQARLYGAVTELEGQRKSLRKYLHEELEQRARSRGGREAVRVLETELEILASTQKRLLEMEIRLMQDIERRVLDAISDIEEETRARDRYERGDRQQEPTPSPEVNLPKLAWDEF